jgi:hypothetical protein
LIGWANVPTIRESLKTESFLSPDTAGVIWQNDETPIDLRTLTKEDVCSLKKKLVSVSHV